MEASSGEIPRRDDRVSGLRSSTPVVRGYGGFRSITCLAAAGNGLVGIVRLAIRDTGRVPDDEPRAGTFDRVDRRELVAKRLLRTSDRNEHIPGPLDYPRSRDDAAFDIKIVNRQYG